AGRGRGRRGAGAAGARRGGRARVLDAGDACADPRGVQPVPPRQASRDMTRPLRISLLLSCAVSMLSGCAPIDQWEAFGPNVRTDTLPHLPPDGLMRSIAADDLEHFLPEPAIPAEG